MENISQQVHSKLLNYYQVKNDKKFAFVILVVTVNSNYFSFYYRTCFYDVCVDSFIFFLYLFHRKTCLY